MKVLLKKRKGEKVGLESTGVYRASCSRQVHVSWLDEEEEVAARNWYSHGAEYVPGPMPSAFYGGTDFVWMG